MSTTIATLTDGIKTRTAAVLGGTYSEAPYGIDFLKNTKQGSANVYSVLPLGMTDPTTVTRSVTYDQRFLLQIANTYINSPMSDELQQDASIVLLELAKNIYRDLISTKCGTPAICLNIFGLNTEDPLHVPESKMIIIEMNFIVKYRELI